MFPLSSGIIYKCEHVTGEGTLPQQRHSIMKEAKFTYASLGKALEKQIRTAKKHGEK